MFEYDPAAPLDIVETGTFDRGGATIHDITYASPLGGTVPAYLVVPGVAGSCWEWGWFPAIIYVHAHQETRASFLPEAITLAPAGVISLLIDAPFLRPYYKAPDENVTPDPAAHVGEYRQLVVDVRRGIDLLTTRPDVDPARIAYVGHGLGATLGGPLAGVEQRIRSYVLIEGLASLTDWYRTSMHPAAARLRARFTPEQFDRYLATLAPLDAFHDIGRAAPAALFFQFARHDKVVPVEQAHKYYEAASEPKEIVWYDTDRSLIRLAAASLDRVHWLARQLAF